MRFEGILPPPGVVWTLVRIVLAQPSRTVDFSEASPPFGAWTLVRAQSQARGWAVVDFGEGFRGAVGPHPPFWPAWSRFIAVWTLVRGSVESGRGIRGLW